VSGDSTTIESTARVESRPSEAALVVPLSGFERTALEMPRGSTLSIGRSRSSSFVVDDAGVSRLHATLRWDGGDSVTITDHGSRNGTLVLGVRVRGERAVSHGTIVDVGPQRFLLLLPTRSVAMAARAEETGAMERARDLARRAAGSDLPVLIVGETGVGKEVLAREIHRESKRSRGPFVAQNCGSLVESLAETTLFGHERGAFTGAASRAIGVFEAASGGTLFLDEIGELSPASQVRMLRVLEQNEIVRVGAARPTPIDTRVVAATHRNLDAMARSGTFRADLLYRLDVVRVVIPPLRDRPGEIETLSDEILRELDPSGSVKIGGDARKVLAAHPWPGNVRELRNALARALALRTADELHATDFQAIGAAPPAASGPLRSAVSDVERDAIVLALEATGGNRTHAAARLGIARRTLLYKIERLGISSPKPTRERDR
jgi:DNA-binding NtrC family response regulator